MPDRDPAVVLQELNETRQQLLGGVEALNKALREQVDATNAEHRIAELRETIHRMDEAALGALHQVGAFSGHVGPIGVVLGIERLARQRDDARAEVERLREARTTTGYVLQCDRCRHIGDRTFAPDAAGVLRDVLGGERGVTLRNVKCECGSRDLTAVPAPSDRRRAE